jgi:hypothetical protein
MRKALLTLAAASLLVTAAHAQIGWTLAQCREHFGQELNIPPANNGWHDEGDWHVFKIGSETASIAFDPDGTVGYIEWEKIDHSAYSMAEIERHLREASHAIWKRTPYGRRTPEFKNQCVAKFNWVGIQNGEVNLPSQLPNRRR